MTTRSDQARFGKHVRSLRRARRLTQEVLAERSGLSPDTVRRLEHGSFSPSLDTLTKLAGGLELQLSTVFTAYDLGAREILPELLDLLSARSPRYRSFALKLLQRLFDALDSLAASGDVRSPDQADASEAALAGEAVEPDPVATGEAGDGQVERASFGAHVTRLREVRGMTKEDLAARSGLAADTIRRLEHEEFSPSLRTLRKAAAGLGLSVAAMFNSFELDGVPEGVARIIALLIGRASAELELIERVLATLIEAFDEGGET
jgi:transcriptional regulator with XRE-family HTH domain